MEPCPVPTCDSLRSIEGYAVGELERPIGDDEWVRMQCQGIIFYLAEHCCDDEQSICRARKDLAGSHGRQVVQGDWCMRQACLLQLLSKYRVDSLMRKLLLVLLVARH
jgi:hypothetical protein